MTITPLWRYLASALAGALLTGLAVTLWLPGERDRGEDDGDKHPVAEEQDRDHAGTPTGIRLSAAQLAANGIVLETAAPAPFARLLRLPGQVVLDADHEARVPSPISGVVREIRAQTGAVVPAGGVLAVLDSRELADAKAQYLAARARRELAAASFTREEGLWQKKISAEQDYLQAKQALAEADIAQRSALQKLLALGVPESEARRVNDDGLARYTLRAPLSGTVLSRDLTVGETVGSDKALFHLADVRSLWVDVAVPGDDLPTIRVGQPVTIQDSAGGLRGAAKVLFIQPELDRASRAGSVRVAIDNRDGRWRAGMFVTAEWPVGSPETLISVPADAIQPLDGKPAVFVLGPDGFTPREVTVGRQAAGRVEVTAGLQTGERYAARAAFVLKSAWLKRGVKDED